MRYMVFADVHGNLEALETALAAGEARGVDSYLFVGDLVGYGPCPLECIHRLRDLQQTSRLVWVWGNHELVVRDEIQSVGYSQEAQETLEWTRGLVAGKRWAREFLASGQLVADVNEFIWLAHDSLVAPSSGHYHRSPQNAAAELACLRQKCGRVCFYAHTHKMRAELLVDRTNVTLAMMEPHSAAGLDPRPLRLRRYELGWVGAGSVGFPTNPKRLTEFLILDDANWAIEKYAMAYPREQARARVREVIGAACSEEVAERIARWL